MIFKAVDINVFS